MQRHNLHLLHLCWVVGEWCFVGDFIDAAHADVLNHVEISEVLLTEGHPETCTLDAWVVEHKALQFFVVEQIGLARSDVWVGEWLVDFERFCLNPFAILIIESFLGNLANVDFWIEVCGESLVVIACIAIHDVEIVNFVEIMLGSVCRVDARYAWVKTTTKDGSETSLLEAFSVCPLPRVFEVGFVAWFIVGCVEIVHTSFQTSFHDGQILIRQGKVHYNFWFEIVKQRNKLIHIVCIHLGSLDVGIADCLYQRITLALCATCNHHFSKHVGVLSHLMCCY